MNCVWEKSVAILNRGRRVSFTCVCIYLHTRCLRTAAGRVEDQTSSYLCVWRVLIFCVFMPSLYVRFNFVTPSGIYSNVFSIWKVLADVLTRRFLLTISLIVSEPSLEWWWTRCGKKIHGSSVCNSSLIHLCSVYFSIYKLKQL